MDPQTYDKMVNDKQIGLLPERYRLLVTESMDKMIKRSLTEIDNLKLGFILTPCLFENGKCDTVKQIGDLSFVVKDGSILREDQEKDGIEMMTRLLISGEKPDEDEIKQFIGEYTTIFPDLSEMNKIINVQTTIMENIDRNVCNVGLQLNSTVDTLISNNFMIENQIIDLKKEIESLKKENQTNRYILQSNEISTTEEITEEYIPSLVNENKDIKVITKSKEMTGAISKDEQVHLRQSEIRVGNEIGFNERIREIKLTKFDRNIDMDSGVSTASFNPIHDSRIIDEIDDKKKNGKRTYAKITAPIRKLNINEKQDLGANEEVNETIFHSSKIINNKNELIAEATVDPVEYRKFCELIDHYDLHVSTFKINAQCYNIHLGHLHTAYYFDGCQSSVPAYLIFKDDRDYPNFQNSRGCCIDLIINKQLADSIGVDDLLTELCMIPFIRKTEGIEVGIYTGRLGSIQRRKHDIPQSLFHIGELARKELLKEKTSFLDVVEFVAEKLTHLFKRTNLTLVDKSPIPTISDIYNSGPSNSMIIGSFPPEIKSKAKRLPIECVNRLPSCISKCLKLKKDRHGLMYGSHVKYNLEDNSYITPCGERVKTISLYWKHPCTVRARTYSINKISEDGCVNLNSCVMCGRGYYDINDSILCEVFCSSIQFSETTNGKLSMIKQTSVGAFGEKRLVFSPKQSLQKKDVFLSRIELS